MLLLKISSKCQYGGLMTWNWNSGFYILVRKLESSYAHPCTKHEMIYQDVTKKLLKKKQNQRNIILFLLSLILMICIQCTYTIYIHMCLLLKSQYQCFIVAQIILDLGNPSLTSTAKFL